VVLPLLTELLRPYEVDLEDKGATITIHYRTVPADEQPLLRRLIQAFCLNHRMSYYEGPFALEIRLHESIKKREGLKALLEILGDSALPEEVFFAGDDENDADAMQWLVSRGGTAVTVGGRIEVAGATAVANPHELLDLVRARHQLASN
jgi:trehalose-6-phosphatase